MSRAIVDAVFSADASRLVAWRPILDDKVHVRIGNRPPAVGLAPALGELKTFLANVRSFGGRYREVWDLPDATLIETEIICWAAVDGAGPVVPCAPIFRTAGGPLALDVRLCLDPQPMFGLPTPNGRGDDR